MSIKSIGWPVHEDDEKDAVNKVLSSGCTNYWTGTECREFEKEYAAYTGTKYAVALMNGTVALEAALYALNIGKGDEVITTCRTFIASASCIIMRGATPVLADVDLDSQNITADTIEKCITQHTKAIIVVHLAGWSADMDAIMALAKKHQLKVIEDCAQAHGAEYKGMRVGSFGDVAAFSFCQDKIITTGGEGGMITTNNEEIWRKIWSYKDHGKDFDKIYNMPQPSGFKWLHDTFGTNWRMTEIQAAIGRKQLKKLNDWILIRRRNAAILTETFKNIPAIRIPTPMPDYKHVYYKYYIFIQPEYLNTGWTRDRIMQEINAMGVSCFTGSCSEIYLEQAFHKMKLNPAQIKPNARKLGETSLMLFVHPTLTESNMEATASACLKVISSAAHYHSG